MNKINLNISDKNTVRVLVKNTIARMSEEQKKQESKNVSQKLTQFLSQENFETLISYDPYVDEIDISEVNLWAKNNDKKVIIFGQTQADIPELDFEPANTFVIVPGRAFTKNEIRLGRGIGWYDRFLAKYPELKTIGTCFSCQVFQSLPEESHDIRMSQVVFPDNIVE